MSGSWMGEVEARGGSPALTDYSASRLRERPKKTEEGGK